MPEYPPIQIPSEVRTLMIQHQGLGDAFTCNGLTRWVLETHQKPVGLFVRACSFESIAFMYRDIPGTDLILIRLPYYPPEFNDFGKEFKAAYAWRDSGSDRHLLNLTMFEEHGGDYYGPIFDQNFYRWCGLDVNVEKFARFRCDRDPSIEIPGDETVFFMHDDPTRSYQIDWTRMNIPPGKKVVHPGQNFHVPNIWMLWDVIEKAEEIHVINSAFLNMIDYLNPQGKIFWHRYARQEVSYPTLQLNWQILD